MSFARSNPTSLVQMNRSSKKRTNAFGVLGSITSESTTKSKSSSVRPTYDLSSVGSLSEDGHHVMILIDDAV